MSTKPNGLNVKFTLNREGNSSIYGDLDFVCKDGGLDKVLKQVRGISVYPEIQKRFMDFNIEFSPETATQCNNLDITYRADPDDPKLKGQTIAQSSVSSN